MATNPKHRGGGSVTASPERPQRPATLEAHVDDWPVLWGECERWARRWRVPPSWSATDWLDELRSVGHSAAWFALGRFDPERGVTVRDFLRGRILAALLQHYRQEWVYAVRFKNEGEPYNEGTTSARMSETQRQQVRDLLEHLTDSDRALLEHLFWDQASEREIAARLGVSQQAVSKRKLRLFRALRLRFDENL
jgi:RNA polymerase sigma factor (sigma-70 family)